MNTFDDFGINDQAKRREQLEEFYNHIDYALDALGIDGVLAVISYRVERRDQIGSYSPKSIAGKIFKLSQKISDEGYKVKYD